MSSGVIISGLPRNIQRKTWRALYRLSRIALRENIKAMQDVISFGSGAVFVDADGVAHHIPIGCSGVK